MAVPGRTREGLHIASLVKSENAIAETWFSVAILVSR